MAVYSWANYYRHAGQVWPSETLVRMLKGRYIPGMWTAFDNLRAIDVGFGSANNLVFLASLGMNVAGIEIDTEICNSAQEYLESQDIKADLRVGSNRSIPFTDNQFDLLLSWNVLHYEKSQDSVTEALVEYARVMKPGGRFILSTTGPRDNILRGAKALDGNGCEVSLCGDFRQGQVFFCFPDSQLIEGLFGERFKEVLVGRAYTNLFTAEIDSLIVTGVKASV